MIKPETYRNGSYRDDFPLAAAERENTTVPAVYLYTKLNKKQVIYFASSDFQVVSILNE